MTSKWKALAELGQSVWYDNVARPALDSGLLAQLMAEDNVTGGTSNPSIFANAVQKSDLYDGDIASAPADATPQQIFERMAAADITRACDLMRPVWERVRRPRRLHLARGGGRPGVRRARAPCAAPASCGRRSAGRT